MKFTKMTFSYKINNNWNREKIPLVYFNSNIKREEFNKFT